MLATLPQQRTQRTQGGRSWPSERGREKGAKEIRWGAFSIQ